MTITVEKSQLIEMFRAVSKFAAKEALMETGILNRYLTQSAAYRMYGRSAVDKWIREGNVTAHKNGGKNSKVLLDRQECEAQIIGTELVVFFN